MREAPAANHPVTPDGRYFVVRGKLWRMSDPSLAKDKRGVLAHALMEARRAVGSAKRLGDFEAESRARRQVDLAKRTLGERGPVWWDDGAADLSRHLVSNTLYADWYQSLCESGASADAGR